MSSPNQAVTTIDACADRQILENLKFRPANPATQGFPVLS
jgi:hypothetical protein